MAAKKWSVGDGLSAMAVGSAMATGVVAGVEVEAAASANAVEATAKVMATTQQQEESEEVTWDDQEEQRYRGWLRQIQDERTDEAEWSEYDAEVEYRARMKQEEEAREDRPVEWEDEKERAYRRKYIELRKKQMTEASWDEQRAEEEHRERIRRITEANKKQKVVWDDADERQCQARYRKKYSSHI